jgi:hypothetical protein
LFDGGKARQTVRQGVFPGLELARVPAVKPGRCLRLRTGFKRISGPGPVEKAQHLPRRPRRRPGKEIGAGKWRRGFVFLRAWPIGV